MVATTAMRMTTRHFIVLNMARFADMSVPAAAIQMWTTTHNMRSFFEVAHLYLCTYALMYLLLVLLCTVICTCMYLSTYVLITLIP